MQAWVGARVQEAAQAWLGKAGLGFAHGSGSASPKERSAQAGGGLQLAGANKPSSCIVGDAAKGDVACGAHPRRSGVDT